ncbi:MAG: hypothetical protein FE834_05655 [Gammaproteobacteria bacterium]|nr:hypothetical protein [Gammaproteobacteria bacterium]
MLIKILISIGLLILFFIPSVIWYQSVGNLDIYFDGFILKGQLPYIFSKLLGLYAITFIISQVIMTLLAKLNIINPPHFNLIHKIFGSGIVLLSTLHILLFFLATSSRQENLAWNLLALDFSSFYTTNISLGVFGMTSLLVVSITGILGIKNKDSLVEKIHNLYWIPVCLIYIHALSIGTEFNTKTGFFLYALLGIVAISLKIVVIVGKFNVEFSCRQR